MYAVFRTARFEKEVRKQLSLEQQRQAERFSKRQLPFNPHVGDPLSSSFLREKKLKNKRVYFLVYEEFNAVLLVAVSDKKQQQKIIEDICEDLALFHSYMKELMQRGGYGRA